MQDCFQGLAVVCNSTYINAGWGVTQRKSTEWYFVYRVFLFAAGKKMSRTYYSLAVLCFTFLELIII